MFCFDLWVDSDRMTHTVILMSTIAWKWYIFYAERKHLQLQNCIVDCNWLFALHICHVWAIGQASCFFSTHTVNLKLIWMLMLQEPGECSVTGHILLPLHKNVAASLVVPGDLKSLSSDNKCSHLSHISINAFLENMLSAMSFLRWCFLIGYLIELRLCPCLWTEYFKLLFTQ
jgi:hypothetical protein